MEKWRQCQILYDGLDYQTKTLLETMCQGGLLQKDKNQDWDLFEDLAEKTLQWEPASKKLRNSQSIVSRGGLLSLESSIVGEAKIATLMRRIEALETKELANVNLINPPPIHIPIVHTVRHQTMSLNSAPFSIPSKCHRNT